TRATRAALITAGRGPFAPRGDAAGAAGGDVAAAGGGRGAPEHQFGGKKELFRAVFGGGGSEAPGPGGAAVTGQPDSWGAATAGLTAFLDACQEPEILQIALTDAPAVLGWAEWRAIETRYGLGLIQAVLEQAMTEGVITRQPVDVLAHLVL